MHQFLATALPPHKQWMLGILCGAAVLSLIVGICGMLCCRSGHSKRQPTPSLYAGRTFPTRWDVILTVAFFFYYLSSCVIDCCSSGSYTANVAALDMLFVFIFTGLQYLPMVLRLALLPKEGLYMTTPDGQTLPPNPFIKTPHSGAYTLMREFLLALVAALAITTISAVYEGSGLTELISRATGSPKYQEIVNMLIESDTSTKIIIIAGAVIIAPIGEECCFRGFLYGSLRKYAGPVWAAVCSSLIFAVVHLSLTAMVPLIIFALVQCILYEKTKSLRAPMMTHAIFNALSVCSTFCFPTQS